VAKALFSSLGSWTFRGLAAELGLVGQHRAARARMAGSKSKKAGESGGKSKKTAILL